VHGSNDGNINIIDKNHYQQQQQQHFIGGGRSSSSSSLKRKNKPMNLKKIADR